MITADYVRENGAKIRGKAYLVAYLEGERLTQRESILAKCYDCMGYYQDGAADCEIKHCSLYPWNPYNSSKRKKTPVQDEK